MEVVVRVLQYEVRCSLTWLKDILFGGAQFGVVLVLSAQFL